MRRRDPSSRLRPSALASALALVLYLAGLRAHAQGTAPAPPILEGAEERPPGAPTERSSAAGSERASQSSPQEERAAAPPTALPPDGFDVARDMAPRSHALWVEPAWLLAIGPNTGHYNFGGGFSAVAADRVELVVRASLDFGSVANPSGVGNVNTTAFAASFGVALFPYRPRPLNGFFLMPLVFATVFDVARGYGAGVDLGGALELGYQFTAGPVYFAPVFGIGGGVGLGPSALNRVGGVALGYVAPGRDGFATVQVAVLRVGVAF